MTRKVCSGVLAAVLGFVVVVLLGNCGGPEKKAITTQNAPIAESPVGPKMRSVLDFEKPEPAVEWEGEAALPVAGVETQATTGPASGPATMPEKVVGILGRSSVRPEGGLWSLKAAVSVTKGAVVHRFVKPVSVEDYDVVLAGVMHVESVTRSGEWKAGVFLEDADGKRVMGDMYAVTSKWVTAGMDLQTAREEGLDLSRVVLMGVAFVPVTDGAERLVVQTDSWRVEERRKTYLGQRLGVARSFYAVREGERLKVGVVGQYEVSFFERGESDRPWMTVVDAGGKMVLGQKGTGIMLLSQGQFEGLGGVRQEKYAAQNMGANGANLMDSDTKKVNASPSHAGGAPLDAVDTRGKSGEGGASAAAGQGSSGTGIEGLMNGIKTPSTPPPTTTMGAETQKGGEELGEHGEWTWECVWTSSVGAIVEGREEIGPWDRLGQPAETRVWRFMIYQWGEMFVHVDGIGEGKAITWALALDKSVMGRIDGEMVGKDVGGGGQRLLTDIYPIEVRDGLKTALPHEMQGGAPVAMIAKSGGGGAAEKNAWWWAEKNGKKYFGVGLSGSARGRDCLLLLNAPTAVMQAGSFGAYLVPPKVRVQQGELDRNFPGDADNDGFVEGYGFQVVRLSSGRARFVIYPQERPLFYPVYLFTVPAAEREAVGLKDSRVLINIDGKQFSDPPQFPDGSFILQVPYVLDRPVGVEAVLVRK